MEYNIYWEDLTEKAQQALIDSGFEPDKLMKSEDTCIGLLILPLEYVEYYK